MWTVKYEYVVKDRTLNLNVAFTVTIEGSDRQYCDESIEEWMKKNLRDYQIEVITITYKYKE